MDTPPPLPPANVSPNQNRAERVIQGTEGMTIAQVEQEVLEGGRFVFYSYAISIFIMSFRRSSSVRFLRRGVDGTGAAIGYSLLSSLIGWWGIPWGPIFTIGSLITNFRGGKDMTADMMSVLVGSERAAELMAIRRKPASAGVGMIIFRSLMIAAPVALISTIALGMNAANNRESSHTKEPSFAAYAKANMNISGNTNAGNTLIARNLANEIHDKMQVLLEAESKKQKDPIMTRCPVHCELTKDTCIVMMKMQDLRKFDQPSQDAFAETLWALTQTGLRQTGAGRFGLKVVVGLRGFAVYESIMTGEYDATGTSPPAKKMKPPEGLTQLVRAFPRS